MTKAEMIRALMDRIAYQREHGGDMFFHGVPDALDLALLAYLTGNANDER